MKLELHQRFLRSASLTKRVVLQSDRLVNLQPRDRPSQKPNPLLERSFRTHRLIPETRTLQKSEHISLQILRSLLHYSYSRNTRLHL
jgi:hypothetical protein